MGWRNRHACQVCCAGLVARRQRRVRRVAIALLSFLAIWYGNAFLHGPSHAAATADRAGTVIHDRLAQVSAPRKVPVSDPAGVKDARPPEAVHADVAARRVPITSSFIGTHVVIFGAVNNSRQVVPESGYYDIVIVVEGAQAPFIARRKSRVGGIWINTDSATYKTVPSYYAIVSTRPLSEIASSEVLVSHRIGLDAIPMTPERDGQAKSHAEVELFRKAVVRIKRSQNLYRQSEYGVAFIGPSLFRASIELPANITVGPFVTHVYLFRQGRLLSSYRTRLTLEREGLELFFHNLAFGYPFLYGIGCVIAAVCSGLIASAVFRRGGAH